MKLNRTPSLHDRDWRNAENQNWDVIEEALSGVFDVKDEIEGINDEALQLLRDLRDGRITKPTFESGSVRSDGSLMESADRLRTQDIIELQAGDIISPYQDPNFEYSLMLYDNGVFREGWGRGWFSFGESQTIDEDVGAIIIIRRTDGTNMYDDVEEVERHFKIDRQQGAIDRNEILRILTDIGLINPYFEFEMGGWTTGGSKITGENPVNLRATNPIRLNAGDTVESGASDRYSYEFLIRETSVAEDGSYIGRSGLIPFGTSYRADHTGYYYLVIHKNDGEPMTNQDLDNVNQVFNDTGKNAQSGDLMEILTSIGLVSRGALDLKLEVGSVSNDGEFIDLYNRVRPNRILLLSAGDTITTKDNPKYEYSLMYYGDTTESSFESGWGLGYFTFGNYDHTMESTKGIVPVIRRVDLQSISNSDIEEIKRDFTIESLVPSQASQGKISADKFNISGQMDNLMTMGINDFISDPDGGLTPQQFHDMTIDLVNAHSELTDYELHGKDAYGYNMYSYEIKPHVMRNSPAWNTTPTGSIGTPLEIPKIIITGGIHGSERNANYVVHYFMNALLNNPDNIETFDTLAQNVHFVFMPMCNPSGFVDNSYENRAGMNLNRDFGPYGNFEHPESQHVKTLIDKHSNADLHIDYHNFTPQAGKNDILGYALTDVDELKRLTTNTYKYVGRQMQLKDTRYPQSRIHQWAYAADANVGTMGKYSNSTHGIPSSIVETPKWQLFFDEVDHGKTVTQLGVDVLSNVIISFMNARK